MTTRITDTNVKDPSFSAENISPVKNSETLPKNFSESTLSPASAGTIFNLINPHLTQKTAWEGKNYARHSTPQQRWAQRFFDRYPRLSGAPLILDIGSGSGEITCRISESAPQGKVMGLDKDPTMIETAKQSFPAIQFVRGDAENVATFKTLNQFYDWIVSFSSVHWFDKPEESLKEIAHYVKTGGQFYAIFPTLWEKCTYYKAVEVLIAEEKWKPFFKEHKLESSLSPKIYDDALKAGGLNAIKDPEVIPIDTVFTDQQELIGWISQWMEEIKLLPTAEKKIEFAEDLLAICKKKGRLDAEGKWHWDGYLLELQYKKNERAG
jgi:trans-aconitate methyltransferase